MFSSLGRTQNAMHSAHQCWMISTLCVGLSAALTFMVVNFTFLSVQEG